MKKKLLLCFFTVVLLCTALSASAFAAENSITVYNWGQYIADGSDGYLDVIEEFTAQTGIEVNYMTFDSNESLYTKLKTGGTTYDIIIPSDYMVGKLIQEDMLEELNFDNIPNYQYIDEEFRNQSYDPENKYSVPYTWGTVGIIYNTKYVDEVTSWSSLWDAAYAGKILMFDNCRDAFAIAEYMLGYDINTEDSNELAEAANLLSAQKDLVQSYVMDQIFDKMEREEAWIAPYYAGDYLLMVEENPNLAFCFPKEGFNVFIDAICIPKGCQNKEGAEAFINFLCDPEISGQNLEFLGYSTPESSAKQHMDPEVASNEIAYPSSEILANATSFSNLSIEASQEMDSLWLSVKTSGSDTTFYLVATLTTVGIALFLMVFLNIRKRRRLARRCKAWKSPEV